MRSFTRQQRHTPDGLGQPVPFEFDSFVVLCRNYTFIRWKLGVNLPRHELPAAHVEEEMILAVLMRDIARIVVQQPRQFPERLLRKDRLSFVAALVHRHDAAHLPLRYALPRRRRQGKAMPIGGHHAHRVVRQQQKSAIQEKPGVFSRDGELGLRDHLAQRGARERFGVRSGRLGDCRKIVTRQRLHTRIEIRRIDGDRPGLRLDDAHIGVGQGANDLVELLGRQGQ